MTIAANFAAPSDLADVLDQIAGKHGTIAAAGYAIPVLIGAQYISEFGAGSAPRVLFVPETKGKIGPPISIGNAASVVSSCDVAIRGAEPGGDVFRFRRVYDTIKVVLSAIARATTGRHEWGDLADDSPLNVDGLGADLMFSFTYQWDVHWDARIARVLGAPANTATQMPAGPTPGQSLPGIAALTITEDAEVPT